MNGNPVDLDTVGILSPGEMGASLGTTLAANGLHPVTVLEGRSQRTRENAETAGIEGVATHEELARRADVVLSVVPSDAVREVARAVAGGAEAAGESLLFAEMNAIAPSTVESIAGEFGTAVDVVDGCIIGPARDLSAATVHLSGPRAGHVAGLGEHGLNTTVLGESIGQASGLKLCYAGMTKGMQALALDLLLSARALDVEAPLREMYVTRRLDGIVEYLDYAFPGTPKRAERRSAEMVELATMFESLGLGREMAEGSHERLRWLGSLDLDTDDAGDATEAARRVFDAAFDGADPDP